MLTNQASYPMGALFVDFYGALPQTEDGYRYILSAKDGFTRYCWFMPTKNMGAQTVAEELEHHIFTYWGLCETIVSDNHTTFTSTLLTEVYKKLNITKRHTVPFNPNANQV